MGAFSLWISCLDFFLRSRDLRSGSASETAILCHRQLCFLPLPTHTPPVFLHLTCRRAVTASEPSLPHIFLFPLRLFFLLPDVRGRSLLRCPRPHKLFLSPVLPVGSCLHGNPGLCPRPQAPCQFYRKGDRRFPSCFFFCPEDLCPFWRAPLQ